MRRSLIVPFLLLIPGFAYAQTPVPEMKADADVNFLKLPPDLHLGEATGVASCFNADVVATAKRDLAAGELLDGEGGYTVWGKLLPSSTSLALGGLPLGLAHNVKLVRAVRQGEALKWNDVTIDEGLPA